MTDDPETGKKKRRRKRRRRGRGGGSAPADLQPASAAIEKDVDANEPAEITPRSSITVNTHLPARSFAILEWVAQVRGETLEQCAGRLLIDALMPMKSAYRDATSGVLSKTAKAGPATQRLTEAMPAPQSRYE